MTPLQDLSLRSVLERSSEVFADLVALSFADEPPITFAELKKETRRISLFLEEQGVSVGDRVAILGENSPNWGIAYLAITTMGAIAVPILPDFHTSEVHHILRHSNAKVVFVSERYFQKVEDVDGMSFSCIVLLNDFSIIAEPTSKTALQKLLAEGSKELQKIKTKALQLVGLSPRTLSENDTASIIYTSGTTGHSKGVMLSHKNIVSDAIATTRIVEVGPGDRMLSILPLAHVYECTLGFVVSVMTGSSVYYVKKPPTAAVLLPALTAVKPTIMLSVPLIIEKMYKSRILPEIKKKKILRMLYTLPPMRKRINKVAGKKLLATFGGCLKMFCIGGSALSPDVEKFLREAGFPYAIGYGLTETAPLVAGTDPSKTRYLSTGPPLPGIQIKILNPDIRTGEGEIAVKGDVVMKGYYEDPERTSEAFTKDGWFRTGDLGVFDRDGNLYIKGRLKNIILGPSGENIYPEAIESVINRADEVLESLVYQENKQLVARVYLDYEKIDRDAAEQHLNEKQTREYVAQFIENLCKDVNNQVSAFSRLARIIEQEEPFEKTPTAKIKRHLYAQ